MIELLDKTLEALLRTDLPSIISMQVGISFEPPGADFPPQGLKVPAIDLFLYDIRENRELRTNEWTMERRSNGTAMKEPPLVRIDFSYLVTAWSKETSPDRTRDEHQLLGAVMVTLLRYPRIPREFMAEGLEIDNDELPTTVLQPGRLQSLAEFWQALGGKPKTALNYTVTLSVPPRPPVEERLVTEKVLTLQGLAVEKP